MNALRNNLKEEFRDSEYRHAYAEESLNTFVATQIKVLREQRDLTQHQLAEATKMKQPRIAVLEDVNYSSWSIKTLLRLAKAFDVRLSVKFETFSGLIEEIETMNRESLQRPDFGHDMGFEWNDSDIDNSIVVNKVPPTFLLDNRAFHQSNFDDSLPWSQSFQDQRPFMNNEGALRLAHGAAASAGQR